ncbi:MAG: site-specific integrase [Clostridiaceae bacterium]
MYIKKYTKAEKTFYMFQGYLGTDPATGKRIRVTRQGLSSPKECELEFYRLRLEFEDNGYSKKDRYTFNQVYDLWMEQYKNTVKESTLNKTLNHFKLHILPYYGKMYIDMIKVTHAQEAINVWFKTLKNYRVFHNYTGLVFKHGMKLGIVKANPTTLVTIPIKKEDIEEDEVENFFTKDELIAFLDIVEKSNNPKWYAIFRLLSFSGCRKGEILALTWEDLNFKKNTLNISKTLTLGLENKLIVQPPKTKKSKRVLPMDERTMTIMKEWRSQQAKDMLKLGYNTLGKNQLVFTNLKNTFINLPKVGQRLEFYCNKIHMKVITPHGFRHTHCSLLFEADASIKEVQERLGHSDIQTTMNIYAHVTQKKKEETADKFAKYINI